MLTTIVKNMQNSQESLWCILSNIKWRWTKMQNHFTSGKSPSNVSSNHKYSDYPSDAIISLATAPSLWRAVHGLNVTPDDLWQRRCDGQVASSDFQGGLCSYGGAWPPLTFRKHRRPTRRPWDTASEEEASEGPGRRDGGAETLQSHWRH